MSRTQFGAYTKKLRLRAGLSQVEVASQLGFKSGQIVSNWERGACYPPVDAFPVLTRMYAVSLKPFFDQYWEHHKEDQWRKIKAR